MYALLNELSNSPDATWLFFYEADLTRTYLSVLYSCINTPKSLKTPGMNFVGQTEKISALL